MISPVQLSAMRARRVASFASRCRIERRVETQDAAGQPLVAWTTLVSDVPCGLSLQAATLRSLSAALGRQVDAVVHLPLAHAGFVREGDRIVVTSAYDVATENQTFEIVHVAPQALTLRCDCRKLEAR